jgi:hypothetical protein
MDRGECSGVLLELSAQAPCDTLPTSIKERLDARRRPVVTLDAIHARLQRAARKRQVLPPSHDHPIAGLWVTLVQGLCLDALRMVGWTAGGCRPAHSVSELGDVQLLEHTGSAFAAQPWQCIRHTLLHGNVLALKRRVEEYKHQK